MILRTAKAAKKKLNWAQLISAIGAKLGDLQYDQSPVLVCPTALKNQPIPWGNQ